MARSLAANCGSVESLKERTRWGCSLCARQMRCTEETLIPVALAIAAAVQWVAWVWRFGRGQRDHAIDDRLLQGRDTRRPRLVAQKPVHAVRHEPLLPAPDARLRLAAAAHDLGRAETVRGRQDDLRPPDVLLRAVPVRDDRFQTGTIGGADFDGDVPAHAHRLAHPASHGNPMSDAPSS